MKTQLRVDVTKEDIKKGLRGSYGDCPIARAARRVIPGGAEVVVTGTYIMIYQPGYVIRYKMPLKGTAFMGQFDDGRKVAPLTLTCPLVVGE
jgi:hypothetical protein